MSNLRDSVLTTLSKCDVDHPIWSKLAKYIEDFINDNSKSSDDDDNSKKNQVATITKEVENSSESGKSFEDAFHREFASNFPIQITFTCHTIAPNVENHRKVEKSTLTWTVKGVETLEPTSTSNSNDGQYLKSDIMYRMPVNWPSYDFILHESNTNGLNYIQTSLTNFSGHEGAAKWREKGKTTLCSRPLSWKQSNPREFMKARFENVKHERFVFVSPAWKIPNSISIARMPFDVEYTFICGQDLVSFIDSFKDENDPFHMLGLSSISQLYKKHSLYLRK
jgi:hypothetical protein